MREIESLLCASGRARWHEFEDDLECQSPIKDSRQEWECNSNEENLQNRRSAESSERVK